ncbi:HIT family protein [Candidatus Sumerlaeota bacterium]|nr:HIT family protein [Candidatus Sumerlaeota bacterium]
MKGKLDATFVYQNDAVAVLMDIQPVNASRLLIILRAPASFLPDLDPETGAEMFRVARKMAEALRRSGLKREGVNLFLAVGEAPCKERF